MRSGHVFAVLAAAGVTLAGASAQAQPEEDRKGSVHRLEHRSPSKVPQVGPDLAPVTIEFFLNLSDGHASAKGHRLLTELAERHPNRLRILYRLTPRRPTQVSHALTLGQEAFVQGRFFAFLDAYYGNRMRNPSSKEFPTIAHDAEVDYERVQSALRDLRHQDQLSSNHARSSRLGLSNYTGLVINGMPLKVVRRQKDLEELYDLAYDESQKLLARGVPLEALYERILERRLGSSFYPQDRPRSADLAPGDELPPSNPIRFDAAPFLKGGHRQGPENAAVSLIFFCHSQSQYCRSMSAGLRVMQRAYPDEVRLIFHPLFETERKGQENAGLMYEAALCADEQDSFWPYVEQLERRVRRTFDVATAVEAAHMTGADMDIERFESCMESGRLSERAQATVKASRASGLSITPALAVGNLLYYGRLYENDLRRIIEAELKPGMLRSLRAPDILPEPLAESP